eukprot:1149623-Pelagomonas_calceolata.AAC.2
MCRLLAAPEPARSHGKSVVMVKVHTLPGPKHMLCLDLKKSMCRLLAAPQPARSREQSTCCLNQNRSTFCLSAAEAITPLSQQSLESACTK